MKSKNNKNATVEEWLHFSWSYLELAEISCDYWVIRLKDNNNFSKNYPGFSMPTNARSFLPIIFNIKHSLELFLKRVSVSLDEKIEHVHDIKELSRTIKDIKWNDVRKKINAIPDSNTDRGVINGAKRICDIPPTIMMYPVSAR